MLAVKPGWFLVSDEPALVVHWPLDVSDVAIIPLRYLSIVPNMPWPMERQDSLCRVGRHVYKRVVQ
jgi:hypothetical protein